MLWMFGCAVALAGGDGPQVDTTSVEIDNPFAARREEILAAQREAREPPPDDRFIPDTPVNVPQVSLPPARRCLDASGATHGEGAHIEGAGLPPAAIQAALGEILPTAARCLPAGSRGTFPVVAAFTVSCSGRVDRVGLTDDGGLGDAVGGCVLHVLRHTPFPAHGLQGGEMFEMPLQFLGVPR